IKHYIGFAAVLLSACNQSALSSGNDLSTSGQSDLATGGDLSRRATDLGGFCGDPASPRIELNGALANSPGVMGTLLQLNCWEAAEFDALSMQLPTPIVVAWFHQIGQGPDPPVMLDLANLPVGWRVLAESGCTSTQTGCVPSDQYTSGFTGTLSVARN